MHRNLRWDSQVEIFKKWDEIPEKSKSSLIRIARVALAIIFLPLAWTQVLFFLVCHFQTRNLPGVGLKLDRQPGPSDRLMHWQQFTRFLRGPSVNKNSLDSLSARPGNCRPHLDLFSRITMSVCGQPQAEGPRPACQWVTGRCAAFKAAWSVTGNIGDNGSLPDSASDPGPALPTQIMSTGRL